jgi:hypothetical protein
LYIYWLKLNYHLLSEPNKDMNTLQKIEIIIKYKELMQTLQVELMNYFELNSIKRILLLNF